MLLSLRRGSGFSSCEAALLPDRRVVFGQRCQQRQDRAVTKEPPLLRTTCAGADDSSGKVTQKKKVVFSKQPSLSAPELINPCCSVAQLVVASVCLWPDPVLTAPPNALFPSLRQEPGN